MLRHSLTRGAAKVATAKVETKVATAKVAPGVVATAKVETKVATAKVTSRISIQVLAN